MSSWKGYSQRRSSTRFRGRLFIVLVAALGGLSILTNCASPERTAPITAGPAATSDFDFSGVVTRIVDGDTFWISSQSVRIRVWGLDAPEVKHPDGSAAIAELKRLVAGQTLRCRQRDIDRYGRIVGQCFLSDGRDVTAEMIKSGTAREYCRFSKNHYGTC